jgi:N-acetylneuraminic acid mutarotase
MTQWSRLSPLPDDHGFAGAFVGVASDALIVAGGANFPSGSPWDGHAKVWHDRIFVLTDPQGDWKTSPTRLPRPVGYGASVSWRGEMICIGGGDANQNFDDVFAIRRSGGQVEFGQMPPLPTRLAMHCASLVGDTIYVAGGISKPDATEALGSFFAMDLAQPADQRKWRELASWPGPPRMLATAASCDGKFFLLGGARLIAGENGKPTRQFLSDAYCYDPTSGWKKLADLPRALAAAPSPAWVRGSSIFVIGGDDGSLFDKQAELRERHPGFCRDAICYQADTNQWIAGISLSEKLTPEFFLPVTTGTVIWRDSYLVPSGEIRPATRTRQVLRFDAAK